MKSHHTLNFFLSAIRGRMSCWPDSAKQMPKAISNTTDGLSQKTLEPNKKTASPQLSWFKELKHPRHHIDKQWRLRELVLNVLDNPTPPSLIEKREALILSICCTFLYTPVCWASLRFQTFLQDLTYAYQYRGEIRRIESTSAFVTEGPQPASVLSITVNNNERHYLGYWSPIINLPYTRDQSQITLACRIMQSVLRRVKNFSIL